MKKQFLLLSVFMYCVSPLIGMKNSTSIFKKFKPQYIQGTLSNPIKGYPVKNIPYKQWDKGITIDGTLVKTPKVKGYAIKNSDFTPIKQEKEDIPEAEYTKIPVSKKRTWGEYFKTVGKSFGFFKAKTQGEKGNFNPSMRKYSTQTNKSDKEMASSFRRELLIAKQQGGDSAVSTKYHQLARQYHPDTKKDSGAAMQILNDIKEEVDKIPQKDINKYLNPQTQTSTNGSTQGSRRRNIDDYYDFNDIGDYLRWEAEYLKRKKEEEEEEIRSGTIIQEAPLNEEELKVRDSILNYINKFDRVRAELRKKNLESSPEDLYAYDVKLADGTIMYINKYALDDDFIKGKYLVGYKEPSKGYARRIYRLQQQILPKDFTNHALFKEKVYKRLVGGLAALYEDTRESLLAKNRSFDFSTKVQAESELEIENMIKDQLKDYEEYVRSCTYNGANHIDGVSIFFTPSENSKSKELHERTSTGFVNGYYKGRSNHFAAIYDLFCNEYIVGNINSYRVEPTPDPFLLLKSYFDALKNNSLPNDSPYAIKNLRHDIYSRISKKQGL